MNKPTHALLGTHPSATSMAGSQDCVLGVDMGSGTVVVRYGTPTTPMTDWLFDRRLVVSQNGDIQDGQAADTFALETLAVGEHAVVVRQTGNQLVAARDFGFNRCKANHPSLYKSFWEMDPSCAEFFALYMGDEDFIASVLLGQCAFQAIGATVAACAAAALSDMGSES